MLPNVLTVARLAGASWTDAAVLGNIAAGLEVEKLGRSQIVFRQHARRQEADGSWTELVTATVQIVCIDFAKFKSAPIPDWLRAQLETLQ